MEFLVLGPLEVRTEHGVLDIGGDRQRKLLAILLLSANVVITVEQLIDELWSEPPQTARRQIYNTTAALRRRLIAAGLPAANFTTVAGGYRLLSAGLSIDADIARRGIEKANRAVAEGRHDDAVRELSAATQLWRGDALAGLQSPFIDSVSARLNEQRVAALERLAELRLSAGADHHLVGDLLEHVTRYPLRESLRGSLMLALSHAGRQAEALAIFESGRRRLADELGLDPGPELRRIHAAVLRGSQITVEVPQDTTLGGRAGHYLPSRVADLVGVRGTTNGVLEASRRATEAGRPTVVLIHGMGGVGKTTLAVELAHQLAPRYPDGQYFIDMRGFTVDQRPLTHEQALRCLLRQAELPYDPPVRDAGSEAAYLRAALSSRRIILLVDNVYDSSFIQQVLPGGSGSLILVTSRRQLALHHAHPINLESLSVADAVALFVGVCSPNRAHEERAACHQVVELCGRLPLAVRAAADRLRHRPLWSVADLAEQLRSPIGRLQLLGPSERSVADVLRVSYGRLPAAHQRLFRVLARHTGPFVSPRACAGLAKVSLAEAEEGLDALADSSMLVPHDRHRYLVHPLLRDLATELAVPTRAA